MYVYIYTCVCTDVNVCICIYTHTYVYVCMYVCMYVHVCVRNISPKGRYMSAFIEGCMMQLASCLKHYLSSVA